jgi:hypothetical protein
MISCGLGGQNVLAMPMRIPHHERVGGWCAETEVTGELPAAAVVEAGAFSPDAENYV